MSFETTSVSLVDRLDVRVKGMWFLLRLSICLATCIMLGVAVLGVDGQYAAGNNYADSNDVVVGGGGGSYYDMISPQLAYNMDMTDLERFSHNPAQDQRPQIPQTIAKEWLINSLIARWLKSLEAAQQADSDSMAVESGNLMKRQSDRDDDDIDRDQLFYLYDANTHLPANSPYGSAASSGSGDDQLSDPANDPEEFEAKLGQLTDSLNHKMSNTGARERLLLGMLNSTTPPTSGQAVADSQPKVDDHQTLDELRQDDGLIHELGEFLQLKLAELKGQSKDSAEDEPREQRQNSIGLDSSSLSSSGEPDDDNGSSESLTSSTPVSRYGSSEYIDHPLALVGHQYVQGGAGEGRQLLGPDGTFENVQVIKTDTAIPSYCDPPNPCPIGYTAKDGCMEYFINSASFSREYQAKQSCSCDNEHSLFQCASPHSSSSKSSGHGGNSGNGGDHQSSSGADLAVTDANSGTGGDGEGDEHSQTDRPVDSAAGLADKLDTLARTIQNRFGDSASIQKLIGEQQNDQSAASHNQDKSWDENDHLVRSARKGSSGNHLHRTQHD